MTKGGKRWWNFLLTGLTALALPRAGETSGRKEEYDHLLRTKKESRRLLELHSAIESLKNCPEGMVFFALSPGRGPNSEKILMVRISKETLSYYYGDEIPVLLAALKKIRAKAVTDSVLVLSLGREMVCTG